MHCFVALRASQSGGVVWSEIDVANPEFGFLAYLIEKYPETYSEQHGRTLRRRLRSLSAEIGSSKDMEV